MKPRSTRVRPAGLLPLRHYRIDATQITCRRDDGSLVWQIALADVTRAEWRSARVGQSLTRVLRLTTPDARHDIRQHLARRAAIGGPDDMEFRATVVAALRALTAAQPDRDVETGPTDAQALALFLTGLGSLIAALALPVQVARVRFGAADLAMQRLLDWGMPAMLALFLGLVLIRAYGPGRKRQMQRPAQIAATLETQD